MNGQALQPCTQVCGMLWVHGRPPLPTHIIFHISPRSQVSFAISLDKPSNKPNKPKILENCTGDQILELILNICKPEEY